MCHVLINILIREWKKVAKEGKSRARSLTSLNFTNQCQITSLGISVRTHGGTTRTEISEFRFKIDYTHASINFVRSLLLASYITGFWGGTEIYVYKKMCLSWVQQYDGYKRYFHRVEKVFFKKSWHLAHSCPFYSSGRVHRVMKK